ncbi:MAG: AEC family transporter [Thermoleophilia bacterium]|nr:AEC family transporter [Thermoleophilia bacterium]
MIQTSLAALLIILAGMAMRRAGLLREQHADGMVNIVLYLAMPALVFLITARAELPASLLLVPVAGFAIHAVLLVLAFGFARLRGMDRPRTGAFVTATAVGNTGFFGLPLIAASGAGFSLPAAVMFDSLSTAVLTWTSTVAIATAFGAAGEGRPAVDWGGLVRGLALPPTWALAAGLAWSASGAGELPVVVERPMEILGGAVLPLVMVYAGVVFDVRGLGRNAADLAVIAVTRLALGGVVGLGVGRLLGLSGDNLHTVVVMAAMPTAMMSLVLGDRYGLRRDVLAGAVVVTTLLCTLTLPIVRWLVL